MLHDLDDAAADDLIQRGTEIGTHAGQQAINTIVRICDTMSDGRESTFATFVAFGYIVAKMEQVKLADPWLAEGIDLFTDLGKKFAERKANARKN